MSIKCRVCGVNEVNREGDCCEFCQTASQDPYAAALSGNGADPVGGANSVSGVDSVGGVSGSASSRAKNRKILLDGGKELGNRDPYGNSMASPAGLGQAAPSPASASAPVSAKTQASAPGASPAGQMGSASSAGSAAGASGSSSQGKKGLQTTGISKNVTTDYEKTSLIARWFRSLVSSAPFCLDRDTTSFQVFPDYTGTSVNAMGYACDQVILYGKVNAGLISENNDVEVYGNRDRHNTIVASHIINRASGTLVKPVRSISAAAVRILTVLLVILAAALAVTLGVEGIVWIAVILLCLTNLPLVFKVVGVVVGIFISLIKRAAG